MYPISDCGRAHFYAPVKIILNHKFSTYWFNIAVMWIVSAALLVLLLFDVPRKFISLFNSNPKKTNQGFYQKLLSK